MNSDVLELVALLMLQKLPIITPTSGIWKISDGRAAKVLILPIKNGWNRFEFKYFWQGVIFSCKVAPLCLKHSYIWNIF